MHGLIFIWITLIRKHGRNRRKARLDTRFRILLSLKLDLMGKLKVTLKSITKKRMHGIILS